MSAYSPIRHDRNYTLVCCFVCSSWIFGGKVLICSATSRNLALTTNGKWSMNLINAINGKTRHLSLPSFILPVKHFIFQLVYTNSSGWFWHINHACLLAPIVRRFMSLHFQLLRIYRCIIGASIFRQNRSKLFLIITRCDNNFEQSFFAAPAYSVMKI